MNSILCSQCGRKYESRACGPTHAMIANERKADHIANPGKMIATESEAPHSETEWLRERGWSLWYNENYWVHPKTVQNPQVQDYTNYGLSLEGALKFEREGGTPFQSIAPFERAISSLYQDKPATSKSSDAPHSESTTTAPNRLKKLEFIARELANADPDDKFFLPIVIDLRYIARELQEKKA